MIFIVKNAFKNKKVIIIASILLVVGLVIPFGIFFITSIPQLNVAAMPYNILLWIIAFVYLLVGFVWGDVRVATWRKKNKEWDTKLPEDVNESIWKVRLTFYVPAFIIFATAIVFDIIYMIAGSYPFM